VRELSEAKHKQQSFIREETEARQMLERHVRRNLADLQSMASSLQKEVRVFFCNLTDYDNNHTNSVSIVM
jgi:C4-dicarboxylate-specific signal transduction histidine kinase